MDASNPRTSVRRLSRTLKDRVRPHAHDLLAWGVERGMPPQWFGYRWVAKGSLAEHVARRDGVTADDVETVHAEAVAHNPLPRNVARRDALPRDRGWWGYSMWDVPARMSEPTLRVTLQGARVLPFVDPEKDYFRPALLTRGRRAVEMREVSFRPVHARLLRTAGAPARRERATWILERVYDNHSHWLTAHLPKLVLLRDRGTLDDVLLPPHRTAVMDASLRRLGLDPERFDTFDPTRPLDIERLTVIATDRFRPELLWPVREAFGIPAAAPHRRVFISRAKAPRRRLINEEAVWPLLERAGFERVFMEELDFDAQVELMGETAMLFAPHGAGLTNMMFCPEGAHVVEIADLSFPNPNFYALASAMGHAYWLLAGEGVGDVHPLEKDLYIAPEAVEAILPRLLAQLQV